MIDREELRRLCKDVTNHPDAAVRWEKAQTLGEDAVYTILTLLDALEAAEAREEPL